MPAGMSKANEEAAAVAAILLRVVFMSYFFGVNEVEQELDREPIRTVASTFTLNPGLASLIQ